MLVITRKIGERVFIGKDICITVTEVERDRIRIGIQAPRDVPIHREEVLPLDDPRREGSLR